MISTVDVLRGAGAREETLQLLHIAGLTKPLLYSVEQVREGIPNDYVLQV